jgi:hypothetical protein
MFCHSLVNSFLIPLKKLHKILVKFPVLCVIQNSGSQTQRVQCITRQENVNDSSLLLCARCRHLLILLVT